MAEHVILVGHSSLLGPGGLGLPSGKSRAAALHRISAPWTLICAMLCQMVMFQKWCFIDMYFAMASAVLSLK